MCLSGVVRVSAGTIRSVTVLFCSATMFIRAGPGQSVLIRVAIVLVPRRTVLSLCSSVYGLGWFGVNCGVAVSNKTCQIAPDQHDATMDLPGAYTDRPGLPRIEKSSRVTPAILNILKPPGWCPGPSRTVPDNPGPNTDRPNFRPGRSVQSGTLV